MGKKIACCFCKQQAIIEYFIYIIYVRHKPNLIVYYK